MLAVVFLLILQGLSRVLYTVYAKIRDKGVKDGVEGFRPAIATERVV